MRKFLLTNTLEDYEVVVEGNNLVEMFELTHGNLILDTEINMALIVTDHKIQSYKVTEVTNDDTVIAGKLCVKTITTDLEWIEQYLNMQKAIIQSRKHKVATFTSPMITSIMASHKEINDSMVNKEVIPLELITATEMSNLVKQKMYS